MRVRARLSLRYRPGFNHRVRALLADKLKGLNSLKGGLTLTWRLEDGKLLIVLEGNDPDDIRRVLDGLLVTLRECDLDA